MVGKIEVGKTYKDREGRPVKIQQITTSHNLPIVTGVFINTGGTSYWHAGGNFYQDKSVSRYDLIKEVKAKKPRTLKAEVKVPAGPSVVGIVYVGKTYWTRMCSRKIHIFGTTEYKGETLFFGRAANEDDTFRWLAVYNRFGICTNHGHEFDLMWEANQQKKVCKQTKAQAKNSQLIAETITGIEALLKDLKTNYKV